jgi:hypothetical protein
MLVVEKKKKKNIFSRSRKFKPKPPITASSRKYPQDDLTKALDEKLSAWKNALALDTEAVPKYIWGPPEDASPEVVFRDPDMVHTQTGWGASVNHRVESDNWVMRNDGQANENV